MTFGVGIGSSRKLDAEQAGRQAAEAAMEQLTRFPSPQAAMVFASSRFPPVPLLSAVRETVGRIQMVGCTTAGEITAAGPEERGCVVVLLSVDHIQVIGRLGAAGPGDPRTSGQSAAFSVRAAARKPALLLTVLADGVTPQLGSAVKGCQEALGTAFAVVGAGGADDGHFNQSRQFFNFQAVTDSVAALLWAGPVAFGVGTAHGWKPLTHWHEITAADGTTLAEIDRRAAMDIYARMFGDQLSEFEHGRTMERLGLAYPLGVRVSGSDHVLVRYPVRALANGAIQLAAEVREGQQVCVMGTSVEEMLTAARRAAQAAHQSLGSVQPSLVLVFNDLGRKRLLGVYRREEIRRIRSVFGSEAALAGFYGIGQFAPTSRGDQSTAGVGSDQAVAHVHTQAVTVLAIGERTSP